MGSPGGNLANDGWNDLFVTGYEGAVRIFCNAGGGNFFATPPDQSFYALPPYTPVGQVRVADVQNKGGLSFIYRSNDDIYINKHIGDPAPAPPKNVSWYPTGSSPTITWSLNGERDINGYEVWRKCVGSETQFTLKVTLGATVTSWTDPEVGIGAPKTNREHAYYYIKAIDAAYNASNPSDTMDVPYSYLNNQKGAIGATELPTILALHESYPNPFNPSAQIKFDLPEAGIVSLSVYDVLGRKITDLVNDHREAGYHSVTWNAHDQASGVYFARFIVSNDLGRVQFTKLNKLMLIR